jgi:hypothetical protein
VSVCACVSTVKGGSARLGVIVFMNLEYGLESKSAGVAVFRVAVLRVGMLAAGRVLLGQVTQ